MYIYRFLLISFTFICIYRYWYLFPHGYISTVINKHFIVIHSILYSYHLWLLYLYTLLAFRDFSGKDGWYIPFLICHGHGYGYIHHNNWQICQWWVWLTFFSFSSVIVRISFPSVIVRIGRYDFEAGLRPVHHTCQLCVFSTREPLFISTCMVLYAYSCIFISLTSIRWGQATLYVCLIHLCQQPFSFYFFYQ